MNFLRVPLFNALLLLILLEILNHKHRRHTFSFRAKIDHEKNK